MVDPQISTRVPHTLEDVSVLPAQSVGAAGERKWPLLATLSFVVVASAGLWTVIGILIWLLLH